MDRLEIYQKLLMVKPFFESLKKNGQHNKPTKTHKEVTLIKGAGGVYFVENFEKDDIKNGGTQKSKSHPKQPLFMLY